MNLTYDQLSDMARSGTARAIEDGDLDAMIGLIEGLMGTGGARVSPGTGIVSIPPLRVGFMERKVEIPSGEAFYDMGTDFLEAKAIVGGVYRFQRLTNAQVADFDMDFDRGFAFWTEGRRIHFILDGVYEVGALSISYWSEIEHLTRANAETHELFDAIGHVYLSGVTAQVLHRHRSYSDSFSYWEEFRQGVIAANETYGEGAVDNLGQYQAPRIAIGAA